MDDTEGRGPPRRLTSAEATVHRESGIRLAVRRARSPVSIADIASIAALLLCSTNLLRCESTTDIAMEHGVSVPDVDDSRFPE